MWRNCCFSCFPLYGILYTLLLLNIGYCSVRVAARNYDNIIRSPTTKGYIPLHDDQPAYPPVEDFQKIPCVLGTSEYYLQWWLTENGKLVVSNMSDVTSFLDLSGERQTPETIANRIYEKFPHRLPIINRLDPQQVNQLLALSVAYTELTAVPEMALSLANQSMQLLSLRGNYFRRQPDDDESISDWDTFPPMPRLRELDLTDCGITTIGSNTFIEMPHLQRLYLSHNCLTTLSPFSFAWLPNLFHLDLSNNHDSKATHNLTAEPGELLLKIPAGLFANAHNLVFLDLSYTVLHIQSTTSLLNLPAKLEMLSLCYTELQALLPRTFSSTGLRVLDLSGNVVLPNIMPFDTLHGLRDTLDILAAEFSNLRSIAFFCTLKKLRTLLLAGNNINFLYEDAFQGLDDLEMVDLSNNHLGNWYQPVFHLSTPALRILKLQNNNINLITTAMFRDFAQLHYLSLGTNTFICNCALRDFMDIAARNSRHHIDCPVLHPERSLGFGPQVSEAIERAVVVDDHRKPTLMLRNIMPPPILRRTTIEPYDLRLRMRKVNLLDLYCSVNNMATVKRQRTEYNVMMVGANTAVPPVNVSQFQDLRLAFGQRTPTKKVIDNEIMNFTFQLLDFENGKYTCINTTTSRSYRLDAIANCSILGRGLDYGDLLPLLDSPNHIVAAVLGSVAVIVIGFLLLYYYWWYIRFVWMTLRNSAILSSLKREKKRLLISRSNSTASDEVPGNGNTYTYDVFVSYCESNRDWILNEFLPNMDQCSDIKVCLHERDFQVGLSILENIIHCMDTSRYLLLVVSESFLLSQWCQFEMHLAQHRLLETRREQLILILLEDIPRRKRPQTLHYLMRTKTYIKWPPNDESNTQSANRLHLERRQFWRRLKRALVHNDWDEERTIKSANVPAQRRHSAKVEYV